MFKLIKIIVVIAVISIFYFFCGNSRAYEYDKGYESAWNGEKAPSSFFTSKEEKEGHEHGLDDVWMYDTGYYDATNKH